MLARLIEPMSSGGDGQMELGHGGGQALHGVLSQGTIFSDSVPGYPVQDDTDDEGSPVPWYKLPLTYPIILYCAVCFTLMSASISLPLLVSGLVGVKVMGAGDALTTFNGIFDALTAGISFFTSGFIGKLGDHLGHKKVIAAQCVVMALPPLVFCIGGTGSAIGLYGFRIGQLFSQGLMAYNPQGGPALNSYFSNSLPPECLFAGYAWIYALVPTSAAAIILGVGNRVMSMQHGHLLVLLFSACSAIASAGLASILPTPPSSTTAGLVEGRFDLSSLPSPIAPFKDAFANCALFSLCVVAALITFAEGLGQSSTLYVYIVSELKIMDDTAAQQSVSVRLQVISQLLIGPISLLLPVLLNFMSKKMVLMLAIILCAIAASVPVLVEWTKADWSVTVVAIFLAFMVAPQTVICALVPEAASSPDSIGSAQGAIAAFKQFMICCGALSAATIYNYFNRNGSPGITFLVFGGIALLSLPLLLCISGAPTTDHDRPSADRPRFARIRESSLVTAKSWLFMSWRSVVFIFAECAFAFVTFLACMLGATLGFSLAIIGVGLIILFFLPELLGSFTSADIALANWMLTSTRPQTCCGLERDPNLVRTGTYKDRCFSNLFNKTTGVRLALFICRLPIPILIFAFELLIWYYSLSLISKPFQYLMGYKVYIAPGANQYTSSTAAGFNQGLEVKNFWETLGLGFGGFVLIPLAMVVSTFVARAFATTILRLHANLRGGGVDALLSQAADAPRDENAS